MYNLTQSHCNKWPLSAQFCPSGKWSSRWNDAIKSNNVFIISNCWFLIYCRKVLWFPPVSTQECLISNQYKCSMLIKYKTMICRIPLILPFFHRLKPGLSTKCCYLNQYIPHYRMMNISSPRLLLQMNNLTVLYQSGLGVQWYPGPSAFKPNHSLWSSLKHWITPPKRSRIRFRDCSLSKCQGRSSNQRQWRHPQLQLAMIYTLYWERVSLLSSAPWIGKSHVDVWLLCSL